MKEVINIGIIGIANIALRSVIPSIIDLGEYFRLYGLASRNAEKAKDTCRLFNTKAYQDYDELINDDNLDAVYIPLPNALHASWIEKSLQKGLHVLVEKSLACNLEDALYLNNLAREKSLVLLENFQFQFHSQLYYIKELLQENKIGGLRCIRSAFGFPPFPDKNNIRYKKELGGGALLDAGAYPVKISQVFLGNDLDVESGNLFYDENFNVDIWGGGCLKQKNGSLFSQIAFGFDNFYQCNIELWGSKGKISTNRIFTAPPDFEPVIILQTSTGSKSIKLPSDNHFIKMLIHFYDLITLQKNTEQEYLQNINQARLISELKTKSNGQ
ncbi:MAG: Gfo/Idh/MocA family protein [Cyclobacteriaceae bacterium]